MSTPLKLPMACEATLVWFARLMARRFLTRYVPLGIVGPAGWRGRTLRDRTLHLMEHGFMILDELDRPVPDRRKILRWATEIGLQAMFVADTAAEHSP